VVHANVLEAEPHVLPRERTAAGTLANRRPSKRQPRDVCPQRRRLPDPDHEAFVDWFVTYWRRHGAQLFTGETTEKEAHEPNA
jgi:hypothetical protein